MKESSLGLAQPDFWFALNESICFDCIRVELLIVLLLLVINEPSTSCFTMSRDMRDQNNDMSRSMRSVFGEYSHAGLVVSNIVFVCNLVGNIPYDATEEKLKEIFSAVGPVISFRLVKI